MLLADESLSLHGCVVWCSLFACIAAVAIAGIIGDAVCRRPKRG